MQFLNCRVSLRGILYVFNIQIFKDLCFLTVHAGPKTQGWLAGNSTPTFLLGNNENYALVDIKQSFFHVSPPGFES